MTVRPCAAAIVVCRGGKFTVERAGAARLQYETVPDKQKADVIRKAKRGFEDVRIGPTEFAAEIRACPTRCVTRSPAEQVVNRAERDKAGNQRKFEQVPVVLSGGCACSTRQKAHTITPYARTRLAGL